VEGGKLENPVKNSPSIGENQQNSSGPQWWEVSTLTTLSPMLSESNVKIIYVNNIFDFSESEYKLF
jgi:hypothetical protein